MWCCQQEHHWKWTMRCRAWANSASNMPYRRKGFCLSSSIIPMVHWVTILMTAILQERTSLWQDWRTGNWRTYQDGTWGCREPEQAGGLRPHSDGAGWQQALGDVYQARRTEAFFHLSRQGGLKPLLHHIETGAGHDGQSEEWNWHRNTMRWQRQSLTWRWTCLAAVSTTKVDMNRIQKVNVFRQRTMSFCVQSPLMAQTSCSLVWYRQGNGNECGLPKTRTNGKKHLAATFVCWHPERTDTGADCIWKASWWNRGEARNASLHR